MSTLALLFSLALVVIGFALLILLWLNFFKKKHEQEAEDRDKYAVSLMMHLVSNSSYSCKIPLAKQGNHGHNQCSH